MAIVEVERASCDLVTGASDDTLTIWPSSMPGLQGFAMRRVEVLLITAFEWNVGSDERAVFEDAYLISEYVDIEDTATCGVGHAIEIAADAHHALMGEPSFELLHRTIGSKRQRPERRLFFGEGLVDDPLRGCVHTWIGDRVQPSDGAGH